MCVCVLFFTSPPTFLQLVAFDLLVSKGTDFYVPQPSIKFTKFTIFKHCIFNSQVLIWLFCILSLLRVSIHLLSAYFPI